MEQKLDFLVKNKIIHRNSMITYKNKDYCLSNIYRKNNQYYLQLGDIVVNFNYISKIDGMDIKRILNSYIEEEIGVYEFKIKTDIKKIIKTTLMIENIPLKQDMSIILRNDKTARYNNKIIKIIKGRKRLIISQPKIINKRVKTLNVNSF